MNPTLILLAGVTAIFIGIVLALIAAGVMSGAKSGVSRSLDLLDAFSSAPASMKAELDPGFRTRVLEPSLRWFGRAGRRLTPIDHNDRMRKKLDLAGNPGGWGAERVTSIKAVGLACGLVFGLVVTLAAGLGAVPGVVATIGMTLAGYYGIDFWLYQKAFNRKALIQMSLADSIDLLTISVEAGLGFDAALAHVAKNTDGPLAEEFRRVLQEMQIGMARSDALRALGERSSVIELRGFTTAMVQADAFGIPVGKVLRVQSSEMRVKRRQLAEEKAQKVPVKILFPLIFFILPTLFLVVMGPAVISMMGSFSTGGL
jgi:tight adherence protein C